MRGWFDWRAIDKRIERSVDEFLAGPKFAAIMDKAVLETLAKPEFDGFWFVKHMQARMMEVDKTLTGRRAWTIAATAYREYLSSKKIEFGDPQYAWDRVGARDVIQAMEIDHWESAA